LLLNGGHKTHLSKNPVMSGWVDALIETFPDARIIVMMRDPAECIPSCLKLVQVTWSGKGWQHDDYALSLQLLTEISFEHFEHPRQVLSRHEQTPQIVVDYRKFTAAPRETVHSIYEALNLDMSERLDSWLLAQAEREKKHQGKFEYSLGEFFLRSDNIYARLKVFYEQYQWPVPNTQQGDHVND
ncbi:MAG: sulfotransferase, partial [Halioglobus sp.]|nr:sulfotransferase [Halioglobus sp.]